MGASDWSAVLNAHEFRCNTSKDAIQRVLASIAANAPDAPMPVEVGVGHLMWKGASVQLQGLPQPSAWREAALHGRWLHFAAPGLSERVRSDASNANLAEVVKQFCAVLER